MKKIFSKLIKNNEEENRMEKLRGFEVVSQDHRQVQGEVKLPLRGTKTSAGYDFYALEDIVIKPGESVFFATDVKAYMQPNEVLLMDVRSSIGIKQDLMLANTIGIVDSDYYSNEDNDGNIRICLRNLKPSMKLHGYQVIEADVYDVDNEQGVVLDTFNHDKILVPIIEDLAIQNTVTIQAGDRVAQGFFVQYLESDNCNTEDTRNGGIGSTTV